MYIPYDASIVHVVVWIYRLYQALNMYAKQLYWYILMYFKSLEPSCSEVKIFVHVRSYIATVYYNINKI